MSLWSSWQLKNFDVTQSCHVWKFAILWWFIFVFYLWWSSHRNVGRCCRGVKTCLKRMILYLYPFLLFFLVFVALLTVRESKWGQRERERHAESGQRLGVEPATSCRTVASVHELSAQPTVLLGRNKVCHRYFIKSSGKWISVWKWA